MKAAIYFATGLALVFGCATEHQPAATTAAPVAVSSRSTAALAFDPSVSRDQDPIDVSRDERGNSAFVGFEDSTTTYFNTYTDDRKSSDFSGGMNRETVSEKVGDIRR